MVEDSSSESEDNTFSPVSGSSVPHTQRRQAASSGDCEAPFDVLLTCYTLFERQGDDQQRDRSFLCGWQWSHMVMDEAHAVSSTMCGLMRDNEGEGPTACLQADWQD